MTKGNFKFKINNKNWEIKEISQNEMREQLKQHSDRVEEFGKYYGLTYADTQTIYLDNTYITHLDQKYSEEDVVDTIANSHDIIREIVDKYFN
mgnify:CR=1 FL=1